MASSFTAQVVLKKTYRLHLTALPALEGQIQSIGPKIAYSLEFNAVAFVKLTVHMISDLDFTDLTV